MSLQFNSYIMSGNPKFNSKVETSPSRPVKKRTFVTELEMQRQERISGMEPSKRQLTFSTNLDLQPENSKGNFYKSHLRREDAEKMQEAEAELKRARSAKAPKMSKPVVEALQKNIESQLNQNVIRLKMEEMTFKYKLKISNLLKELSIPAHEMNRFNNIARVDDILNFLSEKVREKIVSTQINEANINKVRSKEKGTLNEYEIQIESLTKKLREREASQKQLKNKVKELHSQSQDWFDKLNMKQKQLSSKVTQLYQLKTNQKQSQKTFQNLQYRYDLLEKQASGYREQLQSDSKDIICVNKELRESNAHLNEKLQEVQEELQSVKDKQSTLTDINTQLSQELARWRERFQDMEFVQTETKQSIDSHVPQTEVITTQIKKKGLKKSVMSVSINMSNGEDNSSRPRLSVAALEMQNLKLSTQVEQLLKKNKQLSRDILNFATIKERYQKILGVQGEKSDILEGLDSQKSINSIGSISSIGSKQSQLQIQYQKKIEEVVKEWRQKLYEIVNKYEDDLELSKAKVDQLSGQKQQLERKVKDLAVQKYSLEKKVIALEKEGYELLKMQKNANGRFQDTLKESQSEHLSQQKSRKSSMSEIKEPTYQSEQQTKGEGRQIPGGNEEAV